MRETEIELYKESFKFSSGHFTIFSKTERENLHGHNFTVSIAIKSLVEKGGMTFNYSDAKKKIQELCAELNEYFLIPEFSEFLEINKDGKYYKIKFNDEELLFLERDIKILPVENITVEELSYYFLNRFIESFVDKIHNKDLITEVKARVFSGPGQNGSARWSKNND